MSNLQVHKPAFSWQPTTFQELKEYAEILAKSTFVPKIYQGKAGDILAAIQYGAELGLKPLQSLQNIAVINGRPSIYGDAALALVKAQPSCLGIEETFDEVKQMATCTAARNGSPKVTSTFSKGDAEKAGLWGKSGPWTSYPKRMLQMRARSFALRDQFPDVLLGLILAEEAEDYKIIDMEPEKKEPEISNVVSMREPPISINSPPTTYRFAELNGMVTDDMTGEETLKYFENKIESLNNEEDLKNYEKFRTANKTLFEQFYNGNKRDANGLSHTLASRKDFIKRTTEETKKSEEKKCL